MDVGVGLDGTLGLTLEEEASVSQEAVRLGYTSVWTPSSQAYDSFQLCAYRWAATRAATPEGLTTGISVMPVNTPTSVTPATLENPVDFALRAASTSAMTGGRFILGIGTGSIYRAETREALRLGKRSVVGVMRDYLTTLRALVAGETVTYEGTALSVRGAKLGTQPPPRTPVYLAALGPAMLRLAGELADGVALNWCSPEQTAWSRERLAEGAARAGRDPSAVRVMDYIRVCVDDDPDVARRAFTRMVMRYALGPGVPTAQERQQGYRAHFERMGFSEALAELDKMRERKAPLDEMVEAFPRELLDRVGYHGRPEGAAAHVRQLAEGLDLAVVRVVAARPGVDSTLAVMRACAPASGQ